MDHERRIAQAVSKLADLDIDALLVTDLTNVRYLTGFSGSSGQVVLSSSGATFLSDPRYRARAAGLVKGAQIVIYASQLKDELPSVVSATGATKLGVEAASMTIAERDELAAMLEGVEMVSTRNVIEELRRVKSTDEVEKIREAVRLADEAYEWIRDRLVPGVSERQIALDLEVRMRELGADGVSFEPIVGSGGLSAHIHHTASQREFEKGDLVLMDFGARVDGYCSDITRTVVIGPATDEQKRIYDVVLAAQAAGIAAITPGADCRGVDASARKVIDDAGYGETFAHGLGHGVGLDIHEAPRFAKISEDTLLEGDVVTVEPGVYVSDFGGIRTEDDVLVTADGPVVLNTAPRDRLIEL